MTKEEAAEIILANEAYTECPNCSDGGHRVLVCTWCASSGFKINTNWIKANLLLETMSLEKARAIFNKDHMTLDIVSLNGRRYVHPDIELAREVLNRYDQRRSRRDTFGG